MKSFAFNPRPRFVVLEDLYDIEISPFYNWLCFDETSDTEKLLA